MKWDSIYLDFMQEELDLSDRLFRDIPDPSKECCSKCGTFQWFWLFDGICGECIKNEGLSR